MSAFVCTQKHYETVRTSLEHNWSLHRDQPGIFNRLFWPNEIDQVYQDINNLCEIWQRLNIETVAYKYAHGDKQAADEEIVQHLAVSGSFEPGEKLNRTQLFKALQCIHYQIETEHLPRDLTTSEREALQTLDNLLERLPKDIISDTEEYEQTEWAID